MSVAIWPFFVKYNKIRSIIRSDIQNHDLKDEDKILDWWKLLEKSLNDKVNWTQDQEGPYGWQLEGKVLFFEFTKNFS